VRLAVTGAPDFSPVARSYATSRPGYPAELFAWLASVVPAHDVAWDTATGSGQAAIGLGTYFARVVASDVSAAQVAHAKRTPRVAYCVSHAETAPLAAHSVDLVVAAAALHWFDRPRFYDEARRVLRPGGVLAAWTYHVAHVAPPFDAILGPFYRDVVAPYFAPGARLVDGRYAAIELPGVALTAPSFEMTAQWTAAEILRFVGTWSGVHAYRRSTGQDPARALADRLDAVCGARGAPHTLRWPVYLRAARV